MFEAVPLLSLSPIVVLASGTFPLARIDHIVWSRRPAGTTFGGVFGPVIITLHEFAVNILSFASHPSCCSCTHKYTILPSADIGSGLFFALTCAYPCFSFFYATTPHPRASRSPYFEPPSSYGCSKHRTYCRSPRFGLDCIPFYFPSQLGYTSRPFTLSPLRAASERQHAPSVAWPLGSYIPAVAPEGLEIYVVPSIPPYTMCTTKNVSAPLPPFLQTAADAGAILGRTDTARPPETRSRVRSRPRTRPERRVAQVDIKPPLERAVAHAFANVVDLLSRSYATSGRWQLPTGEKVRGDVWRRSLKTELLHNELSRT